MTQGQQKLLCAALTDRGLPVPTFEVRFAPPRKWRADALWSVPTKLLMEVSGGAFLPSGGRHTRGAGWLADMAKLNAAACLGYRVLTVTPQQLMDGKALMWIEQAFALPTGRPHCCLCDEDCPHRAMETA